MMKIRNLFLVCAGIAMLFSSCDEPDETNKIDPGKQGNYWDNLTSLVEMGMKGKVKTIKDNDNMLFFNEDGNITSTVQSSYKYDEKGRMTETIDSYDDGGGFVYITTYEYNNEGYYIPLSWHHPAQTKLLPGLSKITSIERAKGKETIHNTLYKMENGKLNIYEDGRWNPETESNDTTELVCSITYDGAYPVSFKTADDDGEGTVSGSFFEASYQANGMFDVVSEGFYSEGVRTRMDKRTTYFKADNTYLLKDKYVNDVTSSGGYSYDEESYIYTTTYTYNDHKDVVSEIEVDKHRLTGVEDTYTTTYTYVYDDHGNWTECTCVYTFGADKNENRWTRTIEYYE